MAKVTHPIGELGPLVRCILAVSEERERILKKEGKKIPDRVQNIVGLADTGSDGVLIDSRHIGDLNLPVRSMVEKPTTIDGPSPRFRCKCEVGLIIPLDDMKVRWDGSAYTDANLKRDCQCDLIIGRDVLASLNLHYDGPNCCFTIWHESPANA
ncbi:MAG TPA: hypothetical protein VGY56_02595 [Verrucomicrobiae bacterium]|nr:hypothetical protein [Verrucomicrobiae bacterium]